MADPQLELVGSMSDVTKAVAKCKLMHEISNEKPLVKVGTSIRRRSSATANDNQNPTSSTGFNIYFSYCDGDQPLCTRLAACLISEGYSLCQKSSKSSFSTSDIAMSDVILIAFSEKYYKDVNCIAEFNYARSVGKCLIPFMISEEIPENAWLSSITLAESFYDLFEREIDLEFVNDFDLEYDQLLSTLVSLSVSK